MRCAYCRRPLDSLQEVTLDHVVPVSLWRSCATTSLVLACASCNGSKANRLPLSMALLLVFTYGGERSADSPSVDWRLLARLAHAHQPTYRAVWTPDPTSPESPPGLRDDPRHGLRHTPVTRPMSRPDCLRAPRPVRACSRPTGQAVPA
ncbi:HNH endonuclease [Streptomyces alboflavus]|uniref:HNH endonuclease n=1 Tax=Streptomyces alboflavus TaxID=67267 RepID=UPI0036882494